MALCVGRVGADGEGRCRCGDEIMCCVCAALLHLPLTKPPATRRRVMLGVSHSLAEADGQWGRQPHRDPTLELNTPPSPPCLPATEERSAASERRGSWAAAVT